MPQGKAELSYAADILLCCYNTFSILFGISFLLLLGLFWFGFFFKDFNFKFHYERDSNHS